MSPYTDGIDTPLTKLLDYAKENNILINGEISIRGDEMDGAILCFKDNELSFEDTGVREATTETLIKELQKRGYSAEQNINLDVKYDVAVIQTPYTLQAKTYKRLIDKVNGPGMFPIDLEAKTQECSAIGFISEKAADLLDYDYEGLRNFLSDIMDDVAKENPNHVYEWNGLLIHMDYEKNLEKEQEDDREL